MIILVSIVGLYCILMLSFWIGFENMPVFKLSNTEQKISFSVIIPFRNESEQLPQLLNSFSQLEYPIENVEFIFVDDSSSDNSAAIITSYAGEELPFVCKVIKNSRVSRSPKKDAIQTAINIAEHDWIITTDADCVVPSTWLLAYDSFIQRYDLEMLVGPVKYKGKPSFLHNLQYAEFHTLQAVTIGSFGLRRAMMCNGANLGYRKSTFIEVQGFQDNDDIASGDDIFLFEKIYAQEHRKVRFLHTRDAIVTTKPENNWTGLVNQRTRWASKSTRYNSAFTKLVGILVFLTNLAMIASIPVCILGYMEWPFLVILFMVKISIDMLLCVRFSYYYDRKHAFKNYFISGIVYPFLSSYIGCKALFSGYTWKERFFRK